MVERDGDGRPKRTRNAGAFLGPFSGMIPAPSDMLDRYWDGRQAKRRVSRPVLIVVIAIVIALVFLILYVSTPSAALGLMFVAR